MKELIDYLNSLPEGPLNSLQVFHLTPLLAEYWTRFKGSEDTKMADYKLSRGIENVVWNPPILKFTIERHGGTVLGSSRAQLHEWILNIEEETAITDDTTKRYRQIKPKQLPLNVKIIAEDVLNKIMNKIIDERIKWYNDGKVRIQIGKIKELADGSAVPQTLISRRKRFRLIMDEELIKEGWLKIGVNLYQPGKSY